MDLPPLASLVALARHRHMGRAAAELHLCAPAVSKHLKRLEHAGGRNLFTRGSLGMEPTAAGTALVEAATGCLTAHAAFDAAIHHLRTAAAGPIDLAVDGDVSAWRIPRILQVLRSRYPELSIRLHPCPSHQILQEIHLGRYLAGWILGETTITGLASLRLPDMAVRICGPARRSAWLAAASLADLAQARWIDAGPASAMSLHLASVFPDRQRPPQVICQVVGVDALPDLVNQLDACCCIGEEAALAGAERGAWAVWPERLPPLARRFVMRPGPHDPLGPALYDAVANSWQQRREGRP